MTCHYRCDGVKTRQKKKINFRFPFAAHGRMCLSSLMTLDHAGIMSLFFSGCHLGPPSCISRFLQNLKKSSKLIKNSSLKIQENLNFEKHCIHDYGYHGNVKLGQGLSYQIFPRNILGKVAEFGVVGFHIKKLITVKRW